jgi:hypothetical protein
LIIPFELLALGDLLASQAANLLDNEPSVIAEQCQIAHLE